MFFMAHGVQLSTPANLAKCSDATGLKSKSSYSSFHLLIKYVESKGNCKIPCHHLPHLTALQITTTKPI